MKRLRIFGLTLVILMMTTSNVFAANTYYTITAPAGTNKTSTPVQGQGYMGKMTIYSSGGGGGYYASHCPSSLGGQTISDWYQLPSYGGVITIDVFMYTSCQYQLIIDSGPNFPVGGTIQNY